MLRPILTYTVLILLIFLSAGNSFSSAPAKPIDELRKSILALDSAWSRAANDLQQKKKQNVLSDNDKREYAKFIAFLSGRIEDYCLQLRNEGGEKSITGLPCPQETSFPADSEYSLTLSEAERLADLDRKLTESLGEFDEQILREEQRLASRMPAERESTGVYGSTGRTGGQGQAASGNHEGIYSAESAGAAGKQGTWTNAGTGSQPSGNGTESQDTGSSQSGQGVRNPAGGAGEGAGTPGTDDRQAGMQEIKSGYDDIVARQLREAAEKETDPELKKKLWEEYRKYKEGLR